MSKHAHEPLVHGCSTTARTPSETETTAESDVSVAGEELPAAAPPASQDTEEISLDSLDSAWDHQQVDALGGEPDLSDIDLLDMDIPQVVASLRSDETVSQTSRPLSIITAEDIRLAGARTVQDALRLVPGVDVADLSFNNSAVGPRGFHGFTARTLLVLIDGRQVFDSGYGGTTWGVWPIMLEDIDRIEVIRGPAGVLWGANAVSGLVNIVSKQPEDQLGLTLKTRVGSRGHWQQYAGYALKEANLSLRISAEFERSDGFRRGGLFGTFDDDTMAGRLSALAHYQLDDETRLTLSAAHAHSHGGFPGSPLAGLGAQVTGHAQATHLLAKWERDDPNEQHYGFTFFANDLDVEAGTDQVRYRFQQVALQFNHHSQPAEHHALTWGVDTRIDFLQGDQAEPRMFSEDSFVSGIVGAYVQDRWTFAPQWSMTLGGRVDYDFYGGFEPSLRGSLAYELNDESILFAGVSRGFQMPPIGIRKLELPLANGTVYTVGAHDVDASVMWVYELGYRGKIGEKLETAATLFWHEYLDDTPLQIRPGPPGLIKMPIDNAGEMSLYGFEWEGKYALHPKFDLLANYTFQEFNWRSLEPYSSTDRLAPPQHKAMIGFNFRPQPDWDITSRLYYVDSTLTPSGRWPFSTHDVDAYARLDLRVEHRFCDDRASVAVGVQNLLDNDHAEGETLFLDRTEVPRLFYGEFRLRIP